MEKNNICFIRAKQKDDYVVSGIKMSGYKVIIPYKDYNLFLRLCREVWFRLRLPKRKLWFNHEIDSIPEDIIIIKDPLIVKEFIVYLRRLYPYKRIIMDYDNRVERSIDPRTISKYVDSVWHYDEDDCAKYNLKYKGHAYLDVYQVKPNVNAVYDVFYVGRDKGRLSQMVEIKKKMEDVGIKTYFHICASREFLVWTNKKYKRFLPYSEYLELLKNSKSILNIVPPGQQSITQREMEAVFDNIKCITNNKGIKKFELYDDTRFFILDNNYELIPGFLERPFNTVPEEKLDKFRLDAYVERLVEES